MEPKFKLKEEAKNYLEISLHDKEEIEGWWRRETTVQMFALEEVEEETILVTDFERAIYE